MQNITIQTLEPRPTVAQFITEDPLCSEITDSVQDVAELLFAADVRHIPITYQGHLCGIISDRDIKTYIGSVSGKDLNERLNEPISNLCGSKVITVSPEDDIIKVIDIMVEQKIGAVPVINSKEQLIGIVSYIDILRELREAIS